MFLVSDHVVMWGVSIMHYINGNIRVSLLVVILCGTVGLVLFHSNLSHEAATVLALATLVATLMLITLGKAGRRAFQRLLAFERSHRLPCVDSK
jgi:hypothetical protein